MGLSPRSEGEWDVPRFGKDKDARKEELDRQAAEEVERLTRRGGPPGMAGGGGMPGMPGMGGMGGSPIGPPSPLERMAAELADGARPVQRRQQPRKAATPKAQQAFTPMPSGEVGSSFGPGGLNPGPRAGGGVPPPPAFGGGGGQGDGGHVTGPPVYNAGEPDEEEEMSITELALMDHAAHTGHRPEDLVMQYDAGSAEEMRDAAMRQFYERQQSRRPGAVTNSPFAPAGMRGPSGPAPLRRNDDPAVAGGALAQRLANRRRREEEEARRAQGVAAPSAAAPTAAPSAAAPASAPASRARPEAAQDEGALARVLARRRAALGVDGAASSSPAADVAPGRRHAGSRAAGSPGLRAVPQPSELGDVDDDAPSLEDVAATTKTVKAPAKRATATRATVKRAVEAAPVKAARSPAAKLPAARAAKAPAAAKPRKIGATLAKSPAAKAPATRKAPAKAAARTAGKAKTVFCIECGEKNPAIAKFCFSCGTRLAAPET